MGKYYGLLRSGQSVFTTRSSHVHEGTAGPVRRVLPIIELPESKNGMYIFDIRYPYLIGDCELVRLKRWDCVFYDRRPGRTTSISRFAVHRQPEPTNRLVVVLAKYWIKSGHYFFWNIVTSYYAPMLVDEPPPDCLQVHWVPNKDKFLQNMFRGRAFATSQPLPARLLSRIK